MLDALLAVQRRLIYFPSRAPLPPAAQVLPGARDVALKTADGLELGAWFLAATAKTFLFRMDVNDPRVFAAAIGVLAAAALLASYIPARRAASVDPMIALRAE